MSFHNQIDLTMDSPTRSQLRDPDYVDDEAMPDSQAYADDEDDIPDSFIIPDTPSSASIPDAQITNSPIRDIPLLDSPISDTPIPDSPVIAAPPIQQPPARAVQFAAVPARDLANTPYNPNDDAECLLRGCQEHQELYLEGTRLLINKMNTYVPGVNSCWTGLVAAHPKATLCLLLQRIAYLVYLAQDNGDEKTKRRPVIEVNISIANKGKRLMTLGKALIITTLAEAKGVLRNDKKTQLTDSHLCTWGLCINPFHKCLEPIGDNRLREKYAAYAKIKLLEEGFCPEFSKMDINGWHTLLQAAVTAYTVPVVLEFLAYHGFASVADIPADMLGTPYDTEDDLGISTDDFRLINWKDDEEVWLPVPAGFVCPAPTTQGEEPTEIPREKGQWKQALLDFEDVETERLAGM